MTDLVHNKERLDAFRARRAGQTPLKNDKKY